MLSKFSVKKPYTVVVGVLLVIVLGYIAFTNMSTDLLPNMNMPYVVVYTTYVGATPEQVEDTITRPMEAEFATLSGVKNINSTSSANLSLVIMEFNSNTNMDTALIELSSKADQLSGNWGDAVGSPVIMKINPNMLPVSIASVSKSDMDIFELSRYVEDTLVPELESVEGVASVSVSGAVEQEISVVVDQNRIDVLNSAILREVDAELADVEAQLNDAQSQLSQGKRELARQKSSILGQIDDGLKQLEGGETQLTTALETARAQREELSAQLAQVDAALEQLSNLPNLTPEQITMLNDFNARLADLRQQRDELARQLEALENSSPDPAAQAEYDAALARREELLRDRAGYEDYIRDLTLLDVEALRREIASLEEEIPNTRAELSSTERELGRLNLQKEGLEATIALLERQIAASQTPTVPPESATPVASGSATPVASDSATPVASGSATPVPSGSATPVPSGSATPVPSDSATPVPSGSATPVPSGSATPVASDGAQTPVASGTAPSPAPSGAAETVPSDTAKPEPEQIAGANSPSAPVSTGSLAASEEPQALPSASALAEKPTEASFSDADAHQIQTEVSTSPRADSASRSLLNHSAYAEEGDPSNLEQALALAQAALSATEREISKAESDRDALAAKLARQESDLANYREALAAYESSGGSGEDVNARLEEARAKIAAIDEELAEINRRMEELEGQLLQGDEREQKKRELTSSIAAIDAGISAITESEIYQALMLAADEDALTQQFAELNQAKAQLEAGISQLDIAISKLEQGIVPGGFIEGLDEDTNLKEARAQLEAAREQALSGFAEAASKIAQADSELGKARLEFEEKRDEALENAGLDGIVTMQMVSSMIGAQNFSMPAGYVSEGEEQTLVRVGEEFATLAELKQLKLFSLGLESIDEVRLLDVATVEITDNSSEVFTKVNGEDGVMLSFEKQSNYSTADVSDSIQEKFSELMGADSELLIVELMNQGSYIDIVVDSVLDNLLFGGALAILILLVFLMDFRPTLVVALSIPISVVAAFVAMYFSGITLNVLSLSGLALGIGMLVDNSIVAIENIYRLHDEQGVPILRACVEGVKQISGALFASTLTTICVFLPVVFVQGITRDLLSDLALTITYSLLASLLVAMTLVPSMSAGLLKRSKPKKQRVFGALRRGYVKLLSGALRVKPLVLLLALALLAYSGYQVFSMNMSFMPEVSSPQMNATLSLDSDRSQSENEQLAMEVMEAIMEIPDVESIGVSSGSMISLGASSGDTMTYYITVNEKMERENSEIARDIARKAQELGVEMSIQTSSMDISMLSGEGISIDVTGPDLETLREVARDVVEIVRTVDGATDISDGLEQSVPELSIVVNKERASDDGLTVAQVYQFVAQKLVGAVEVTRVTLDGKEYPVTVAEGKDLELTPNQIEDLEIEVTSQEEKRLVRIGDIAEIDETMSLSSIARQKQTRVVSVSFNVAEGYGMTAVNRDLEEKLSQYTPPEGYHVSLSGENETVMAIMNDMIMVIGIALILIFLIMVAQFQSFKSPIIVMFTIPLAFTGGLLALILTGMDLSVVAMLGFLVLTGVIVNNGIVFVDCVNQLRIGGMEKREALLETGRLRLRPILMTAVTTILGMSTMALSTGIGAEMMKPMAVVSIGGLIYATFMTLFIVPVLYDLLNGKKMKAREIDMIRESAGLRTDEELLNGDSAPQESSPSARGAEESEPAASTAKDEPSGPDSPAAGADGSGSAAAS